MMEMRDAVVALLLSVLASTGASAQGVDGRVTTQTREVAPPIAAELFRAPRLDIRRSSAALKAAALVSSGKQTPAPRTSSGPRKQSRVAGALLGALGGFAAGSYIGVKLEGDCGCDDPGLKGFLIGAPIGTVIGGILGAKFF